MIDAAVAKTITPAMIDAAVSNALDWLGRGQDAPLTIERTDEDVLIRIDGVVSLKLIVLHALEGAIQQRHEDGR